MEISIFLCIILGERHFLHHFSIEEGESFTPLFFTRIMVGWEKKEKKFNLKQNVAAPYCCRLQLTNKLLKKDEKFPSRSCFPRTPSRARVTWALS